MSVVDGMVCFCSAILPHLIMQCCVQGNMYDDDEEYGDTLDDGGDDGATY